MIQKNKKNALKRLKTNKRGNFADIPEYMRFAFGFALLAVFTIIIMNNFNTGFQNANTSVVPTKVKETSTAWNNAVPSGLDYLFLFGTLVFFIGSIVFARLIPSSPKFIIIGTFLLILFPLLAMMLENIWDGFNQQTAILAVTNNLIFMPFMLNNLRYIALAYTFIVGVALYTKNE